MAAALISVAYGVTVQQDEVQNASACVHLSSQICCCALALQFLPVSVILL
ncbi:hypothetical protein ACO0LG_00405 [Undibacterium sp. Ji42W]